MARGLRSTPVICAICLIFTYRSSFAQTVMPDVEGFEGGTVTLPCTLAEQGTLRWICSGNVIATKPLGGPVIIDMNSPWNDVVNITGEFDLRINSLKVGRDNILPFICDDSSPGGGSQETTVRVLARIAGASILEANNGKVTLTAGEPKTLTCTVTGNPCPDPSYTWTVGDRTGAEQGSTFNLTDDKSTTSVKCTATNSYSNGSVLSTAEATATLNVLYLDSPITSTPVTVTENERVTLSCRAEGNPPPGFVWRRSATTKVKSSSANYTIENVKRSAAGEYTCTFGNSVGSGQTTVTLVVQYPPDVTVIYDSSTQTLTCTADGVPNNYTFLPWEHRVGGKLVQTLHTISTTFTLPDTLTYEDTGDYVCSVSNGIKQTQAGHLYIAPQTAAVFQDQEQNLSVGFGKTQEISVPFYTYSETPNVKVEWRKSGESNLLQSHREEKGPVSLVFHGLTVSIEGTVTVLTLRNVTQSDEGNYTVSVTSDINGMTETKHTYRSVYVDVKIKPTPATARMSPGGAVTVSTPSADTQVLVLTLRDVTQPDEGNYTVPVTSDINGVNKTKHKSVYAEFRIIANEGADVGGSVGGALAGVVVVVTVTVGILWYKRKRLSGTPQGKPHRSFSKGEKSEPSTRLAPVYEVTSFEQNYQNVNPEPHYEQLQKSNQNSPVKCEQYDVEYENGRTRVYEHSSESDDEKSPSTHYINSGAIRHDDVSNINDDENKGGHYVDPA